MKAIFTMRWCIILITVLLQIYSAHAQKYKSWFPVPAQAPLSMQKQIKQMTTEFEGAYTFKMDTSEPRKVRLLTAAEVLNIIDRQNNFDQIFPVQYWSVMDSNYVKIIPQLIDRITNTTVIGLENADDILIWERMTDKQKSWLSYAYIINDDLYQIAGRANFLLKKISGENYGDVRIKSSPEKLKDIQSKWQKWYKDLTLLLSKN